jgi:hypothetical protein
MNTDPQRDPDEPGRILPFRRRRTTTPGAFSNLTTQNSPVREFDPYPPGDAGEDDHRHRMKMNALALVVVMVLIGGGMWIVDMMAQLKKNQDCVLSGGRNCAAVVAPAQH